MTLSAAPAAERAPAPRPRRRQGRGAGRWLLAALSGALLVLAFPPHDLWPLAPVSAALLLLVCRGVSVRRGAALGLVSGLGFYLPLLHWAGAGAGPGAWLALAVLEALFTAALGAGLTVLTRRRHGALWSGPLWVLAEALRDRLPFGGFPWGRLAFSQASSPLLALANLGGAPLVTCAVALLGAALAALLVARGAELAWVAGAAGALLLAAGLTPVPTDGPRTTVAVVQGNVPRLGLDLTAQRDAVLRNHAEATHELAAQVRAGAVAAPALVVWPENTSDLDPYNNPDVSALITGAVRDIGVPVLVGALVDGPGRFISNSGIVWDPVTGPGASYVKRHPVPFGEYIPLRALARRFSTKVDLVPRDFAHGRSVGALTVGPAKIGDVICYEVAYDNLVGDTVRAGGELLVVQTNNATFGHSGETSQQLAMGRLRAVEHGRTVLIAATSGVSAVIAPDGQVLRSAPIFTRRVLVASVPRRTSLTWATRLGAVPEYLLSLLALGALSVAATTTRRTA